jgi:hypothetical protein
MQAPLEICYAGVVIARSEEVREGEGGEFFIVMKEPLPVGTLVGLRSADSLVSVRVLRVVESADGADTGMQVRPAGSDEGGAAMWIPPPPATKPVSTPPASATQSPAAPPASDQPAPSGGLATRAVEAEAPARAEAVLEPAPSQAQAADGAPVGKEEQAPVAEPVPVESAAPAGSTDRAAPEAVPVTVASSLTGALEEAATGEPEASAGTVEASNESPGSGDVVAPVEGDLPPARPVQGSGGRRRTKRRR